MSLPPFAVTWDYRCPFSRNVHEHLVCGLEAGADWRVTFTPFSLTQIHVTAGEPAVWDEPNPPPDHLAMECALFVRDHQPESFLAVHKALYAARFDTYRELRDPDVVADILDQVGLDGRSIVGADARSAGREVLRHEHEEAVQKHQVFGVPTFIVGDNAAFARIMTRPRGDSELAHTTIERLVSLIADHAEINELKHTTIPN